MDKCKMERECTQEIPVDPKDTEKRITARSLGVLVLLSGIQVFSVENMAEFFLEGYFALGRTIEELLSYGFIEEFGTSESIRRRGSSVTDYHLTASGERFLDNVFGISSPRQITSFQAAYAENGYGV